MMRVRPVSVTVALCLLPSAISLAAGGCAVGVGDFADPEAS